MEDARNRLSISDWGDLAELLTERYGIRLTKDLVYKTAVGNYRTEPSMKVLYALTKMPEFQLRNGQEATMEVLAELLYGRIDLDGNPVEVESLSEPDNRH